MKCVAKLVQHHSGKRHNVLQVLLPIKALLTAHASYAVVVLLLVRIARLDVHVAT